MKKIFLFSIITVTVILFSNTLNVAYSQFPTPPPTTTSTTTPTTTPTATPTTTPTATPSDPCVDPTVCAMTNTKCNGVSIANCSLTNCDKAGHYCAWDSMNNNCILGTGCPP